VRFVPAQRIGGRSLTFNRCAFAAACTPAGEALITRNCVFQGVMLTTATLTIDGGMVFQGGVFAFQPAFVQLLSGVLFQSATTSPSNGAQVNVSDAGYFDTLGTAFSVIACGRANIETIWGVTGAGNPFGMALDKTSCKVAFQPGGVRTLSGGVGKEIHLFVNGAITWAAAQNGIKDGLAVLSGPNSSDAVIMPV
jgi:hypothetical protein